MEKSMSKLIDVKIENRVYHTTYDALMEVYTLCSDTLELGKEDDCDPYLLSRGMEVVSDIMKQIKRGSHERI